MWTDTSSPPDETKAMHCAIKCAKATPPMGVLPDVAAAAAIHHAAGGRHPHVVDIWGVVAHSTPAHSTPAAAGRICTKRVHAILMPQYAGDLLQHVRRTSLTAAARWRYTAQILDVLVSGKACGVSHGDVKLANVLLCEGMRDIVVTDFGASVYGSTRCSAPQGTPTFMAPEVLSCRAAPEGERERRAFDVYAADVWSLGVTLMQLALPAASAVFGRHDRTVREDLRDARVPRAVLLLQRAAEEICDPHMARLIRRALVHDPARRATAEELQCVAAKGAAAEARCRTAHRAAMHAARGAPSLPETDEALTPHDLGHCRADRGFAERMYILLRTTRAAAHGTAAVCCPFRRASACVSTQATTVPHSGVLCSAR